MENDDSWRVEFQQNVELKPGLYFTSTIITLDDLLARLHGTAPRGAFRRQYPGGLGYAGRAGGAECDPHR